MSKVDELLKHVKTNTIMAAEHRCDAIKSRSGAMTIEYWRGREDAWLAAEDLIRHYLKGELDYES